MEKGTPVNGFDNLKMRSGSIPIDLVLLLLTIVFGCSSNKCYKYETNRIDNVKCLKVYDKDLLTFFSNISSWHGLERLTIYSDTLRVIPEELCQLTQLKVFHCNFSKLTDIEPLTCLDSLTHISLIQNNIKEVPEALLKKPQLKVLAIFDNPLSEQELQKISIMKKDSLMVLTQRSRPQQ